MKQITRKYIESILADLADIQVAVARMPAVMQYELELRAEALDKLLRTQKSIREWLVCDENAATRPAESNRNGKEEL